MTKGGIDNGFRNDGWVVPLFNHIGNHHRIDCDGAWLSDCMASAMTDTPGPGTNQMRWAPADTATARQRQQEWEDLVARIEKLEAANQLRRLVKSIATGNVEGGQAYIDTGNWQALVNLIQVQCREVLKLEPFESES